MQKNQSKIFKKVRVELDKISAEYDPVWRQRSRTLDTKFMLNFIFRLVLNTDKGYGIILSDLLSDKSIAKKEQKQHIAASSLCEARDKFPEKILKDLNSRIIAIAQQNYSFSSIEGHKIFAIDGSKISLAKELENFGYHIFNSRAYYPSGLLSCLYNVDTHLVHDFSITKDLSERNSAINHIKKLQPQDILIFDRGYFSFLLLKKIRDKSANVIFRLQRNLRNKEILKFEKSKSQDKIIDYTPSTVVQHDLKKSGFSIDFSGSFENQVGKY